MNKTRFAAKASAMALGLGVALLPGAALAVCAAPVAGTTLVAPDQLLSRFPEGGGGLVSEVRNLVATNPANLDAIVALAARGTAAQKRAIGAGLGQAAGICARPDPDTARRIQEATVRLDDREILLAFQAVTGDRQTAAAGGRGGGAGGNGGGIGGGGVGGNGVGVGGGGGASNFFGNSTSVLGNTNASGHTIGGPALALRPSQGASRNR
ncbi:hypothetical protein [Salinarimonas soli]|uniref:hypothetical protein n=1 Tax=Salinarimonas soli TaxID=1638099 RepID=UPI001661C452|nr:hypothetical protein [Salinarimonas soli]